jgi:hypothetical protein
MRAPCPLEADEGKTLVAYLRRRRLKFHHSPNETGHTDEAKRRAIRMKQQGTSAGYPDYTIIVNGHMLFIELKRVHGSKTSDEQLEWIQELNRVPNVQAFIAYGAQEAINIIESYIYEKPLQEITSTTF